MLKRFLAGAALASVLVTAAAFAAEPENAEPQKAEPPMAEPQKPAPQKSAAAPDASRTGPRTLDDINIEGQIAVPQVLFITARDQRRLVDFQHRRYLRSGRQLGEQTVLPQRIVLTGTPALESRKESHP
jgi:hypothetical protein